MFIKKQKNKNRARKKYLQVMEKNGSGQNGVLYVKCQVWVNIVKITFCLRKLTINFIEHIAYTA